MNNDKAGYIYVLSNEAMPGILKIGRSIHSGKTRAKEIYKQGGTGVPLPFKMEFEVWSDDCVKDELCIHSCFYQERINSNREFFSVSVSDAIKGILSVVCSKRKLMVDYIDSLVYVQDVASACNEETVRFINDLFPGKCVNNVIRDAVSIHLENEDIIKIINKHKEFCDWVADEFAKKSLIKNQ